MVATVELDGGDAREGGETAGGRIGDTAHDDAQAIAGEAGEQLLRRRRADEAALVEDRDVVGDPLDVVEDVGGVEDRRLRAQAFHEVEDVAPADGVERAGGLIEQQHLRPADEGLGDAEPLAHPARVGPGPAIGGVRDPRQIEGLVDPALDRILHPGVEAGDVAKGLARGHPVVEPGLLAEVADRPLVGLARRERDARDGRAAARRPGEAGEDLQGRVVLPAPLAPRKP